MVKRYIDMVRRFRLDFSIKDNLEKSSLNVTILDSEYLLFEEGKHMRSLPYIAQLLGACNSDDVPKALIDKITKIIGKEK